MVAKGTINLTDGEISPATGATNTMLWVGYRLVDTTPKLWLTSMFAGVINAGENLQMQVGRRSPADNDVKWYRSC